MDEARSSCPGPKAEDTLHRRASAAHAADHRRTPVGTGPHRPHRADTGHFRPPLRRGQGMLAHQRWPWIAEDLFDEDKW